MKPKSVFLSSSLVLAAAFSLTASSCKKDEAAKGDQPAPQEDTQAAAPSASDAPAPAEKSAGLPDHPAAPLLTAYEQCRAQLAADASDKVPGCAEAVAKEASSLGTSSESSQEAAQEIENAAKALAEAPADDIEAQRVAFGELSKAVIGLLKTSPELSSSYNVFECSMTKGYNRWVQLDGQLANPYMGEKMLTCGVEVKIDEG